MWAAETVTPPIQVIPVACCLCVRHTFITHCSDHWNAMCATVWKSRRQWNRSVCIRIGCISFNDRSGPWPWHYNLLSPRCYQLLSSWLTTWTVAFWRKGVVLKDIWFWFLFDGRYLRHIFIWQICSVGLYMHSAALYFERLRDDPNSVGAAASAFA